MANVIVGIHGLSNKPPQVIETQWWQQALHEGLAKNCGLSTTAFAYHMVYWAKLLYKHPLHDDAALNFDTLYNQEPYLEAASGHLKPYKEGWMDMAKATSIGWAGGTLDALKGSVDLNPLVDVVLAKKLRDLAFYYDANRQIMNAAGQWQPARHVLMEELSQTLLALKGQRIMLIAHSMGSIIAYDVLRNLGQVDATYELAHFVTIGSPLGIPLVKVRIFEERQQQVRTPTVVTECWVNYADRRDAVAVDTHLADDYAPNSRGVRVQDDLVLNDYVSPRGQANPHKSYGYLRTPELSHHVQAFLSDP